MRNIVMMCVMLASVAMLSGCASILNPFESEFACPNTPKGKCISIKGAYQEDVASTNGSGQFSQDDVLPATDPVQAGMVSQAPAPTAPAAEEKPCCGGKPDTKERPAAVAQADGKTLPPPPKVDIPKQEYREASLKKVTKLLRDPVTPIVAPPQVMRVLILPYEDDDGALNLMRYKYVMVDRPKWVLGDYLSKEEEVE